MSTVSPTARPAQRSGGGVLRPRDHRREHVADRVGDVRNERWAGAEMPFAMGRRGHAAEGIGRPSSTVAQLPTEGWRTPNTTFSAAASAVVSGVLGSC